MKLSLLAFVTILSVLAGCSKEEEPREKNYAESLSDFTKKQSESLAGQLEKLGESLGERMSEGKDAFTDAAEQALEDIDEQMKKSRKSGRQPQSSVKSAISSRNSWRSYGGGAATPGRRSPNRLPGASMKWVKSSASSTGIDAGFERKRAKSSARQTSLSGVRRERPGVVEGHVVIEHANVIAHRGQHCHRRAFGVNVQVHVRIEALRERKIHDFSEGLKASTAGVRNMPVGGSFVTQESNVSLGYTASNDRYNHSLGSAASGIERISGPAGKLQPLSFNR